MATIPKKVLIELIAEKTDTKRQVVRDVIQAFLDHIVDELAKGNRFEFREFGVFEVVYRKNRVALNPKTMEKVKVPAKAVVHFKPGKQMKTRVSDAFEKNLANNGEKGV
ncbi:MAG: hypothetical protein Kow00107_10620 [Planctomycetota bacterium]